MEKKIDHRKHYLLILDTETANTFRTDDGKLDISSALVYDCGFAVIDTKGNTYAKHSFVNADIFYNYPEAMNSAYYANKIPRYKEDLRAGTRKLATTYTIRKVMCEEIEKYRIREIIAHNSRFDYNSLNATQRYITKSKYRYFLPYGIEVWDSLKMARDVILKMPTYRKFCEKYNLFTANGKLSATAENLYRFITKNPNFVESHTGLEDVEIEKEIVFYCYRQHKKMRKKLFE
jgi:hypothetical protein